MNARALAIVASLHGLLVAIAGATSISLYMGELRPYVTITVSTDHAVLVLGAELALDPVELRVDDGEWWYRARSSRARCDLWVEVLGPRHEGPPPPSDVRRSSVGPPPGGLAS